MPGQARIIHMLNTPMLKAEWKRCLQSEEKQMCNEMRLKTQRGLAVGSKNIIKRIDRKLQYKYIAVGPR